MVKYLCLIGILCSVILSPLLLSTAVYADDPGGLNVNVNIAGNNPDVGVNMYGNNPNVWINGTHLDQIASFIGYSVGTATAQRALTASTPNGTYSGASTGYLPPLGTNAAVAEVAPGKYMQPLVGWKGYFCPDSNLDPSVYHGSGCGGTWGVCDGYSDFWCRRQIAGLAPEFVVQQEKLNTVINALAKVISMTESNAAKIEDNGSPVQMEEQLSQLKEVKAGVSSLEEDYTMLANTVARNAAFHNRQLNLVVCVFSGVLTCMFIYIVVLTVSIKRMRKKLN